jgi:hypothetical protein
LRHGIVVSDRSLAACSGCSPDLPNGGGQRKT